MKSLSAVVRRLLGLSAAPGSGESSPELEFFNSITGELEFELEETAEGAVEVRGLRLEPEIYLEESEEFRPLSDDECALVVLAQPAIRLRGESGTVVLHRAPNGSEFTVDDLLAAILETERRTRAASEFLGGVDTHHRFLEGIRRAEDGVWEIAWGS
ncbi:MAG: hypothetical protein AAGC60_15290 [Acidobacteriota bacterium]